MQDNEPFYLALRNSIPPLGSIPSKRYPTSSKKRRLSPLFLNSVILFKGFINPLGNGGMGRADAGRTLDFPLLLLLGDPSGVAEFDFLGEGESNE